MNACLNRDAATVRRLPIAELPEGAICPPLEPDHPTWSIVAPWDDPLASRGGYAVDACKVRETVGGEAAIRIATRPNDHRAEDRMFVIGEPTWRAYGLTCRLQPLADTAGPTFDEPFNTHARCGLVFRIKTVRHYYTFCVEDRQRLVLYRRDDAEWTALACCAIDPGDRILTLRIGLDGDAIRAECPECEVVLEATDWRYPAGRAGFRTLGDCRLYALEVAMTPGGQAVNDRRAAALSARTARCSTAYPDAVEVGTLNLGDGRTLVGCEEFFAPGRHDLLFATAAGMVAESWEGEVLWQCPEILSRIVFSADPVNGRRRIYALAGTRGRSTTAPTLSTQGLPMGSNRIEDELVTVDGATGRILKRVTLPVSPREDLLRYYDLSYNTGRLADDSATAVLVREWRADWGGGGEMLWAFDGELKPLWERKVHPGYGHHNAVHCYDYDGDGRDEVLAGGNLLAADGTPIWRHDRADGFLDTLGGQHYDAALIGHFAADAECDPVVFLIGGSAGVYVVEGRTGRTRAQHLIGHAQWALPCKVRDDLPGTEIMVGTRWGNFGILTLFSGRGDRLWSIQPDYLLQGSGPVQWTPDGPQLIWCCRSAMAMGLYDGHGRRVKSLDRIRALYGEGTKKPTQVLRRTPDGTDLLGVQRGDTLHLFGAKP